MFIETELSLSGCLWPYRLALIPTLRRLYVNSNAIEVFPDTLAECQSLEELRFGHNLVESLPKRFGLVRPAIQ